MKHFNMQLYLSLLLPVSEGHVTPSALCSRTHTVHVVPLMSEPKLHSHRSTVFILQRNVNKFTNMSLSASIYHSMYVIYSNTQNFQL